GNICTCIVIARNKYMHTATNYYLFSLAVSDLLLLVLGIPQELFSLWQKYPYTLGEFWCVLRGFGSETSTNASILLISAFTVERFFAICNPLKSHTMSQLPRAIKIILIIWVVSALSVSERVDKKGLQSISRVCSLKRVLFEYCFETTAIVFFLVPITLISVLYILIGINLRRSSNQIKSSEPSLTPKEMLTQYHHPQHSNNNNNNSSNSNSNQPAAENSTSLGTTTSAHHSAENLSLYLRNNSVCSSSQQKQIASRRSVIRMLVAVVIAFFVCYSPFHAQRVLASMMTRYSLKSQTYFFYHTLLNHISGITYYLSATMNPILYQVLSRKFRIAFRDTFGGCLPCLRTTLPEITYSNIVGGASSYKLSRTGSFYSNGSFPPVELQL
ncbi:G-protein coupled receptor, partial [Tyrophagus putrescentiae]